MELVCQWPWVFSTRLSSLWYLKQAFSSLVSLTAALSCPFLCPKPQLPLLALSRSISLRQAFHTGKQN